MKIDFSRPITDLESREAVELKDEADATTGKPRIVTLQLMAVRALLSDYPDERLPGEQKLERFRLAQMISDAEGGVVEIDLGKLALVKTLIGKAFATRFVGPAWMLLES